MSYIPFTNFVFRTPAFSIEKWKNFILDMKKGNNDNLLFDNYFLEAIFIGSPILYDEILKYREGRLPIKEKERLFSSLLRYLTRMSWRCTPFGLFSGCSIGEISDKNEIILPNENEFKRYTRLDMNYLCALIQNISQKKEIRSKIKYYPNTSLYSVSNQLRYIEYTYQNTYRKHNIISVDNSTYLQTVLKSAEKGENIDILANKLVNDDITHEEAEEFILELIDNQLLVSELEPSVTGNDVLDTFIKKLCVINKDFPVIKPLIEIQKLLSNINRLQIGETLSLYDEIIANVKAIGIDFDLKYLFQTDVVKTPINANISKNIIRDIQEAIIFLNKITPNYENSNLNNFKSSFYNRYEDKEMPLSIVMDNEIGIGYPIRKDGDIDPLLKEFYIPYKQKTAKQQIDFDRVQFVLNKKYIEAVQHKKIEITISELDFEQLNENWTDTPDSIMAICRILSLKEENALVYLSSCGGSSAANLLARFAHAEETIERYVKQITKKEKDLQSDSVIAEIVHLPESRIGNIIFRPTIRNYEIPYLANSSVETEFQISVSDLFISIKNNQIFLRSQRLNKRIIPRLTNAHNYSMNGMPVYQFLCDLQTENQRAYFNINWNDLTNDYPFLPRISYKNVILSFARWLIKTEDFKSLILENTLVKMATWRKEKLMPRYLFLPDGDNEFFVDMENMLSIKNLIDTVKLRKQFYLYEFPFDTSNTLIRDSLGNKYTNELIFGFYKDK